MKPLTSDPVVLGACGVIILSIIVFIWLVNAYRKASRPATEESDLMPLDLEQEAPPELEMGAVELPAPAETEPAAPEPPAPEPAPPPAVAPKTPVPAPKPEVRVPLPPSPPSPPPAAAPSVANPVPIARDVLDRLEVMNQRLGEMQNVLSKQMTAQPGPAGQPTTGQGFSPETIDKLLRIIGNVVMQVEILQRGFNAASAPPSKSPAAGGQEGLVSTPKSLPKS